MLLEGMSLANRNASEEDIKRIVEESGADTIIHTAAISDISTCIADPDASYHANVMIPLYLAKAALTTGPAAISFQRGQPLFLIQHLKPLQTSPI